MAVLPVPSEVLGAFIIVFSYIKIFQISDMPLTTTLVALESISSNYEGWIDFDITNSALKWVGTME